MRNQRVKSGIPYIELQIMQRKFQYRSRITVVLGLLIVFLRLEAQNEPWRPAFHFTPPSKWMNDPNGLVYHSGKYHLFYQHYPDDIVWGPMHWGHAVSTDLLHWKHLPIALYPDSLGWIFSGSAVIDKNNTSGFGKDAMVAIFTYHNDAIWKSGRKNTESQGVAYSLDEGLTWTKYKGNPVLNNSGEQDFRDPKVSWNQRTSRWNMVLAAGDRIKFFSSTNLKDWTFESDFIPDVKEPYGVWECPDLFPMKAGTEEKWVLILSQNMNGPNGGSATRYIIGNFDGRKFTAEAAPQWVDQGMDYYAAVTFDNAPDGRRILLGWMSNWLYATKTPTQVWRSAMALPREITLIKTPTGYGLKQTTVTEFRTLIQPVFEQDDLTQLGVLDKKLSRAVIETGIRSPAIKFRLELYNTSDQLLIEVSDRELVVNRSRSGIVDFSNEFASHPQKMFAAEPIRQIQLILDESSIEISVNNGMHWMTIQYFPRKFYNNLHINGSGGPVKIWRVKSIWSG